MCMRVCVCVWVCVCVCVCVFENGDHLIHTCSRGSTQAPKDGLRRDRAVRSRREETETFDKKV
jgi:hypothetical protein